MGRKEWLQISSESPFHRALWKLFRDLVSQNTPLRMMTEPGRVKHIQDRVKWPNKAVWAVADPKWLGVSAAYRLRAIRTQNEKLRAGKSWGARGKTRGPGRAHSTHGDWAAAPTRARPERTAEECGRA